ncbi:MAG: ABC transporter ATP-binding protein [Acutalibacter sp.]|nr:ABC transporter ATP-binding protein [Acutalibacter sp.]
MMLELRNIYKTYLQGKLEVPVLGGISLSVEEGEYVAIMGPSGSGKTTLMNIIGCLDNPTSGEYYLGDENIAQLSEKRMSDVRLHSIGFVFQSFYLLSRQSALDNVALPLLYAGVRRRERQEIARRALERVGLGDRTDFKPTQLSGGQCQRVAIARAIVNNPKIILADEPTGALDTKSGAQIMEIFQSLNDEGVTIVMITHEPEIAAHAKRVLHIRDGLLLGGAGQPLPQEQAQKQPPVPPPPQPPQPKPVSGTQAPPKAKPAPKPAPAQAGSASEAKKAVPLEQKAPPPPTGKVIPASQITEPEEPISGASILASLERQLDALKQDSAKGEVSNNES